MNSRRALRLCMQSLVLLNLVFVQMTGAAGLEWLVPLYGLALAAPLLERFRELLLSRVLWNGGVVCFSLLLLRHSLQADLASVREDGLILAALCQVNLLNNLRSSQRPDLLFFNAFLIAIIAGFICRGLAFPVAFLLFIPCYVVGLQLLSATRDGNVLSPSITRRVLIDGGRRAAVLLASSLLVFVFWPRDFERKAYFHGKIDLTTDGSAGLEIGFNEELLLGRKGSLESTEREVMRVTLLEGDASEIPTLWRGSTLGSTEDGAWRPLEQRAARQASAADLPWRRGRGRLLRPPVKEAPGPRVAVLRLEQGTERVFAPLGARALKLAPEHGAGLLRPGSDGTIDTAVTGDVRYELTLAGAEQPLPAGPRAKKTPAALRPYLQLPLTPQVASARALAERLSARLPDDVEQHELVTLLEQHLSETYRYLSPGAEGAADSLDEFLQGSAGGHCEFFASALATMLRSLDVPCRVVTGYRGTAWNARSDQLTFLSSDAHAWVEVFDPTAGWLSVDPSPRSAVEVPTTHLWARLEARVQSAWETVTNFDDQRRAALFAWVRTLPARTWRACVHQPWTATSGVLLVAFLARSIWLRRRRSIDASIHAYRRALRRAKVRLEPGETPRELLHRATNQGLEPARARALEAATLEHEAARYAPALPTGTPRGRSSATHSSPSTRKPSLTS